MRVRDLYIESCRWHVRFYIASTCYYTDEIYKSLVDINCPAHILPLARENIENGRLNTGLTYSNEEKRESVIVIALASSPSQFLNSVTHELRHLTDHISNALGYEIGGEPIAYLMGDIVGSLWGDIHDFICCCHERES